MKKQVEQSIEEVCIHHWVIETAVSTNSLGTCKKCSEEKLFSNSITRNNSWALVGNNLFADDKESIRSFE